jgi:hypothetical protein
MQFIREREPRATPPSVAKVACDPKGIDTSLKRGPQDELQIAAADVCSAAFIMIRARVHVRVENILEAKFRNFAGKCRRPMLCGVFHCGGSNLIV